MEDIQPPFDNSYTFIITEEFPPSPPSTPPSTPPSPRVFDEHNQIEDGQDCQIEKSYNEMNKGSAPTSESPNTKSSKKCEQKTSVERNDETRENDHLASHICIRTRSKTLPHKRKSKSKKRNKRLNKPESVLSGADVRSLLHRMISQL